MSLSGTASAPGDPVTEELFGVHSRFYAGLDRTASDEEMIRSQRLVVRLHLTRLYGVMTSGGRRPASQDD